MSRLTESLPVPTTPLVGRREAVNAVCETLAGPTCRLLTVVGPGGVGKTRLAVEAATQVAGAFADGARFVDLQAVEPADFLAAVADALPLALSGQGSPDAQLLNHLQGQALLLVLDNFEHLLSESPFLSELLRRAPAVKVLVTSREPLHLQDEWRYPLAGLQVPPESGSLERIPEYGAAQLFLDRVRRVRPDFSLEDEASSMVRLCRLVEGLPLALELAAVWARTLSCAEIADEIERNLAFLATPLRDVPERHRSMQAVFDQSWGQLSEEERTVFGRLVLFRGGFDRPAAEAVAGATLPILSALVDKCMVRHDQRYSIHELLRQFGEEKLRVSPEEARQARALHIQYYTTFLHRRVEAIIGATQHAAATEVAAEWENVRAVWHRAVEDADIAAIHRAASTYFFFCQLRSRFLEGATALRVASARLEALPVSRDRDVTLAQLYNHEGWLRIRVGEFDRARDILEQSRALYGALAIPPPPRMGGDSSVPLAITALIQGNAEWAVALCDAARHAAEARGDNQNLAFAHYGLTAAKSALGDYAAAYLHAEQACVAARAAGNHWFLAYPLIEWGNVARALGNYAEAEQHYHAAYAIKQRFDDPEGMAIALSRRGEIAVIRGQYPAAESLFQQSLHLYRSLSDRGGLAASHRGLGRVAHATGRYAAASAGFREALRIAAEIHFWPLLCTLIVDVAALIAERGEAPLAIALLTLVQQHASSDHETQRQSTQLLERIGSALPQNDRRAALARGAGWEPDSALTTLDAALAAVADDATAQRPPAPPLLVEPLTARELEILRLMAEGLTNAAIAERLVLAVGSVKWYASQIYGKLGVTNRTEAAARARELGLWR